MPFDASLIERIMPERPTELELEWKDKLKPDEFSIYSTKLELIAEEAKQLLVNIGVAPQIQAGDCVAGIFTAGGDLSIGCSGTYLHVSTAVVPIKYILKYYKDDPTVGIKDGDVFFANDPLYGGIHAPDMINMVPIYHEGMLIAWAMAAAHEPETGAIEPGGYVPAARSRYEEGLRILPLKVGENFKLKTDVFENILNQCWSERMIGSDMKARVASCFKIRERVLALVQEKGVGFFVGLMRRILEVTAEGAKSRIAELNDGIYRHSVFFDMRGNEEGLTCVHVAVEKKGDSVTIDLSGSSPPTKSFLNARPHQIRACLTGDLAMNLFSDFPCSTGLLAPFKIKAPENTIVNCPKDCAITGCTRLGPYVVDAVHICLSKMLFDSRYRTMVTTEIGQSGRNVSGGGINQHGEGWGAIITDTVNAAGGPARSYRDGEDAAVFWYSGFSDCLDVEHSEVQYPFLYLFRTIPKDQSGFGKFRGGTGISYCIILRNALGPNRLLYAPTVSRIANQSGLFGGYYGGIAPGIEIRQAPWEEFSQVGKSIPFSFHELLENKAYHPYMRVGQCFSTQLPEGGDAFANGDAVAVIGVSVGGYGDVLERDPEQAMKDIQKGIISPPVAQKVYKVVFDPSTLQVDRGNTQELRDKERADRKARSKSYAEFEKEWSKKKPREELLRFYGPWPWGIT